MTPSSKEDGRLVPMPIGWPVAQLRPLIAASAGALAMFVVAVIAEGWPPVSSAGQLWSGFVTYVVFVVAFLLPLWLVQAVIFVQMRRAGQPVFMPPSAAGQLDAGRRCRFLLSLRSRFFVLAVLYVASGEGERTWTRPAWLFLALFAVALLGICLWTIFIPVLPSLLILGVITFWSSALIFGLSHLIRGD